MKSILLVFSLMFYGIFVHAQLGKNVVSKKGNLAANIFVKATGVNPTVNFTVAAKTTARVICSAAGAGSAGSTNIGQIKLGSDIYVYCPAAFYHGGTILETVVCPEVTLTPGNWSFVIPLGFGPATGEATCYGIVESINN